MKKSWFYGHQIITILNSVEAGHIAKDVCSGNEISNGTFYAWKSKFGSDVLKKFPAFTAGCKACHGLCIKTER